MITRRRLLSGVAACAVGTGIGAGAIGSGFGRRFQLSRALQRRVGASLAETAAAQEFIDSVLEDARFQNVQIAAIPVTQLFFMSTTAMAAAETGQEPEFLGLFDYRQGCQNGLSAAFAPQVSA
ncbi:hypothetical protein [Actibacterium sp. 188UL27-1]|uniref:hypothetical protein n=1 Tax=Actibacterium sp. 188UL27-1 TaxID=2786961 RepID=UPI00195EB534|nr:hypothetical protein [Actibacterium sp. 188UL27-1]MBM7067693.1 hypothetical protein [Actibacterium sp. 188UL27-1]